jgi:hypothetical protein
MDQQHQDGLEQAPVDGVGQGEEAELSRGRALGWGVSGATHACAVLALALMVTGSRPKEVEIPPTRVNAMAPPELVQERQKPPSDSVDRPPVEVALDPTLVDDRPPVDTLQVPAEISSDDTSDPTPAPPKGDPLARSESTQSDAIGFLPAIGVGASSSVGWGNRGDGSGKAKAIRSGRGSKAGVDAVKRALRWLARHQSPDGRWDAVEYWKNCTDTARCEPGKNQAGDTTAALTGYALLCFLGDGYDQTTPSTHRQNVRRGLEWLLAHQSADGSYGPRNYEHAIATMAMAQALAMGGSGDGRLRRSVERAVQVITERQNREGEAGTSQSKGLGWDYVKATGRNDASVTGWNVMALKSALGANIDTTPQLRGARDWLAGAWRAANPGGNGAKGWKEITPYDQSRFPYTWNAASGKVEMSERPATAHAGAHSMEPVALMCAAFLGGLQGDPMVESLANTVVQHQLPTAWPCNTYYLYYNTLGMFQVGGPRWEKWNAAVLPMLVKAQRLDNCAEGSWDWEGTAFHGHDTGRVLSTVYSCLSLEVYWIYNRVRDQKH